MKTLSFKKHIALMFIILTMQTIKSFAQSHSCCGPSSTQEFAMLGNDRNFGDAHLSPLPFHFVPVNGKMITFKTSDGTSGNAYEVKAAQPTDKYVFMIHEYWGLNDYIKREAENLRDELGNANVLALDLYDGKVADNPDKAKEYMHSVKDDRAQSIILGAITYAGENAKIQTIGWCFGGGWSLQTALMAKKHTVGCVMYYGMPEKNTDKLKTLNGPVLGIFANKDQWINPQVVSEFEKQMEAAGKPLTVKRYDADHAFANPSNPHYEKAMAAEAHALAVKFIRKNFE